MDHQSSNSNRKIYSIYIYNLPLHLQLTWRDLKKFILNFIPSLEILHIQLILNQRSNYYLNSSALIHLNNFIDSQDLIKFIDGYNWDGYILIARNDPINIEIIIPSTSSSTSSTSSSQLPLVNPQFIPFQSILPPLPPPLIPSFQFYPNQFQPQPLPPPPPPSSQQINVPSAIPMFYTPPFTQESSGFRSQSYHHHNNHNHNHSHNHQQQFYNHYITVPKRNYRSNSNSSTSLPLNRSLDSLRQYPYHSITDLKSFNHDNDEFQPGIIDNKRLFIGNIPYSTTWQELKDFLKNQLKINEFHVDIPLDLNNNSRNLGLSRGFAIVIFDNEEDSLKCINLLDGLEFGNRILSVRFDRFPFRRQSSITSQQSLILNEFDNNLDNNDNQKLKEKTDAEIVDDKPQSYNNIITSDELSNEKNFEDEARSLIDSIRALKVDKV
ncbi:hypothetical protein WICMUC_000145 [Wickerhamomyces mucosus]|uniref:RRM domain-containing protein n=1 Tax=Wickerhamomyces mucosus TaxID=1378264 RepID=A0A9P8TJ71_9ASCO|nr:hypothetical protein WICMUC_000145 [Wickerhamomyces mucosus]